MLGDSIRPVENVSNAYPPSKGIIYSPGVVAQPDGAYVAVGHVACAWLKLLIRGGFAADVAAMAGAAVKAAMPAMGTASSGTHAGTQ